MRDAQEEIGDTLEDAMDSCELEAVRKQIREEFRYELARRDRQIEALREELKRRVDVYSMKHELEMVRTQKSVSKSCNTKAEPWRHGARRSLLGVLRSPRQYGLASLSSNRTGLPTILGRGYCSIRSFSMADG